jgi:hypothetical protein
MVVISQRQCREDDGCVADAVRAYVNGSTWVSRRRTGVGFVVGVPIHFASRIILDASRFESRGDVAYCFLVEVKSVVAWRQILDIQIELNSAGLRW